MFYDMLLLKMLNVSERTRMSVVLHSSEFAVRKLVVEQRTGSTPPLYFCSRLVSGTTIFKRVLSKIGGYL